MYYVNWKFNIPNLNILSYIYNYLFLLYLIIHVLFIILISLNLFNGTFAVNFNTLITYIKFTKTVYWTSTGTCM